MNTQDKKLSNAPGGRDSNCPGCGQHCPVTAVGCGRGEAILQGRRSGGRPGNELDTDGKLAMTILRLGRIGTKLLMESDPPNELVGMLAGHGGWMTREQMANRLGPRADTLEPVLERMAADGWITRTPSPSTDADMVRIALTEAGQDFAKGLLVRRDNKAAAAFQVLNAAERETLLPLLEKLDAAWREQLPRLHRSPGNAPERPDN